VHCKNASSVVWIPSQSERVIYHILININQRSRAIHHMLDLLTLPKIYYKLVKLPTADSPVLEEIRRNTNFFPFFKDCIRAIDGTLIPMHAPEALHTAYRNRKGNISQNVLAVTTISMMFTYVLPRWEGSAADSHVFDNAHATNFNIPVGWYYLANAGYANCNTLLVPYRGVRYHLKEWGNAAERYVLTIFSYVCSDPSPSGHKHTRNCLTTGMRSSVM